MYKARLAKYIKGNSATLNHAMEQRGLIVPGRYVIENIQDLLQGIELKDGDRYVALPHVPLFVYDTMGFMKYEEGELKDMVQADLDCLVKDGIVTPFTLRYWYANRAGDNGYLVSRYGEFFVPD